MKRVHRVIVEQVPPSAWRNGGAVTRELLVWPAADDWRLRISVADIARDGPFSAYAGVRRWFVPIGGAGVELGFGGATRRLRLSDAPLAFDGVAAPDCRLLGGPVRDLNLMCRGGSGGMAVAFAAQPWRAPAGAAAGLFARVGGRWRWGGQHGALPALSLLWFDVAPAGEGVLEPDDRAASADPPAGWWLHYLPDESP